MQNLRSSDDDADLGFADPKPQAAKFERTVPKGSPSRRPPDPAMEGRPDPRTAAYAAVMAGPTPRCPLCGSSMHPLVLRLDLFDRTILRIGAALGALIMLASIAVVFQSPIVGVAMGTLSLLGTVYCVRRSRRTWAGDLCCVNQRCLHTLPRA